jgi:hypothetical protein
MPKAALMKLLNLPWLYLGILSRGSPRRPIPEERDKDDEGKRDCRDENRFLVFFGHRFSFGRGDS